MNSTTLIKTNRNVGLDWLRGLCAISIMLYHYFGLIGGYSFLSKLGVYGVSIFFVLSGLSMAIVYNSFIVDIKTSFYYLIRRFFRILPLHLIIVLLTIIPIVFISKSYDWYKLFLNVTLLFGFVNPHAYIAMGAWSIGNEMVYYLLTPIILVAYNYKKYVGNLILLVSLVCGLYYAFFGLSSTESLANQWRIYINPFNNFFLYVAGIAIYYNYSELKVNQWLLFVILTITVATFIILPYKDAISITTGINRLIYSVLSFILVLCFYKINVMKLSLIGKLFEQFGIATFGVYLLHPVVKNYLSYFIQSNIILIITSIFFTITLALLSYYLFENKLIKIGKKMTTK